MVGEVLDQITHILRHLLSALGPAVGVLALLGHKLGLRRRIALPQFGRQRLEVGPVMAFDLRQKPLDGDRQQPSPAERSHVAEDVGRIQALLGDVEFEQIDEAIGDVLHDLAAPSSSRNKAR